RPGAVHIERTGERIASRRAPFPRRVDPAGVHAPGIDAVARSDVEHRLEFRREVVVKLRWRELVGARGRGRRRLTASDEIKGPVLVRAVRLDFIRPNAQRDRPGWRTRSVAHTPFAASRAQLALERRPPEGALDAVACLIHVKRGIAGGAE